MSSGFQTPTRNRDDPEMEEIDFDGHIPDSPERTTPKASNFRFTAPIPNFRTQFSKTKDVKREDYGTLPDLRERGTPDSTLYDQLINSLNALISKGGDKKGAIQFLLKLGVGWVIGMGSAVLVLANMFESHIYEVSSLFIGFIIFAIP